MTVRMFDRAREVAMSNGGPFHLAALLWRDKSLIRIDPNSNKTHPSFARELKNGDIVYSLHAEMSVVRFAQPGDRVVVLRFSRETGELTMSKPCEHCEKALRDAQVSEVVYSDWDGNLKVMRF